LLKRPDGEMVQHVAQNTSVLITHFDVDADILTDTFMHVSVEFIAYF